jgi:methyltransferase (TIGR00027 family)
MNLSDVSKTAIATLRCHVVEAQKDNPVIYDPMAGYCLDKLASLASEEEKTGIFSKKLSSTLTNHIAIRARKYDTMVNEYISKNPHCTVINLGCGFDTRYWRINHRECHYFDLDLPEVIEAKKEILKDRLEYEMIGCSVLEPSWIDKVVLKGNRNILLVAEALFMYLPKADVIILFKKFADRFIHSRLVLEVVTEKYTRGIWKKIIIHKLTRELGLDAGSSYHFGINKAMELEGFAEGIKVINEWSYIEDPDTRPKIINWYEPQSKLWTQKTVQAPRN